MKLFHVQDSDCPKYILAADWQHALQRWRDWLAKDDPSNTEVDQADPHGIQFIADEGDLIV